MTGIEQLLSVSSAYAQAEHIELSTVSWRALGDTKKLAAMQNGADIQVRRLEKTLQWFSDHWPPHTEWPSDIRRPPPSPSPTIAPSEHGAAA